VEAEGYLDFNVFWASHGADFGIEATGPAGELKVGSFLGYTF